jgi:aspartyl-tRNA(Asn)/glutamyl-tRNA(Gln) amidotransferase subunit B
MRSKENALDYRYFPEPDMPKLVLDQSILTWLDNQKIVIPYNIIKKFKQEYGFNKEYINALILDKEVLEYFLDVLPHPTSPERRGEESILAKTVAKWIA